MTTLDRRSWSAVAVAVGLALAVASCDRGDGKTLQPYDPDDYPSQTDPPPTTEMLDVSAADGDIVTPTPSDSVIDGAAGSFGVHAPWQQGSLIGARHTCDGEDVAPAVSWGGVPAGTTEIALALVDDSAVSDGQPYVHWVIAGLDPSEIALVEGDVPDGAIQAINFFGNVGYDGPCPPEGDEPHLYRLTAYALSDSPGVDDAAPALEVLEAIEQVTLGRADVSGTYAR